MPGDVRAGPAVTRFAPAPTGYLHLGHVVNALCVWGWARSHGAIVRLRIEDHDRHRSRPEYERALLEDLEWLGFEPDGQVVRQRDREPVYRAAFETVRTGGLLYGCACSRADLQRVPPGPDGERAYPNSCRHRGLPLEDGLGWRLRLPDGPERFDDLLLGPQEQVPSAQCGDLLIRDRLGNWTYQFAVVVDDLEQDVTHVIRGLDLLASTGRQLALGRLVGRRDPPVYAHHPLVMRESGVKLSKSDAATGVRELRASGWSRLRVLDQARAWAGDALATLES